MATPAADANQGVVDLEAGERDRQCSTVSTDALSTLRVVRRCRRVTLWTSAGMRTAGDRSMRSNTMPCPTEPLDRDRCLLAEEQPLADTETGSASVRCIGR